MMRVPLLVIENTIGISAELVAAFAVTAAFGKKQNKLKLS